MGASPRPPKLGPSRSNFVSGVWLLGIVVGVGVGVGLAVEVADGVAVGVRLDKVVARASVTSPLMEARLLGPVKERELPAEAEAVGSCTTRVPFMFPCPEPQKMLHAKVNVPVLSGVKSTEMVCPGVIWALTLNSGMEKPCVTSVDVIRSRTGMPFLTVIVDGMNENCLAVIEIC